MTIAVGQTGASADILKTLNANGFLEFADSTTLTIASGVITLTQNFHRVDTESAAASDDLDTINTGSDGFVLIIRPANDAHTVVVKHNTGNIMCVGNLDITLDDSHDLCILVYDGNLTKWMACNLALAAAVATVPANVIAYTTDTSAPSGWVEFTAGRGRILIATPSGGTHAGTVGTALTNLQDPTHTHTGAAHTHTVNTSSSVNTGPDAGSVNASNASYVSTSSGTGATSATSSTMPYIQQLAIKKS